MTNGSMPSSPSKSFNDWLNEGRNVDRTLLNILGDRVLLTPEQESAYVFAHNIPVVCADGFQVSIQASRSHHCRPQLNHEDIAQYEAFELGFPTMPDELLREYSVGTSEDLTKSVFAYVPRAVVEQVIANHGGIVKLAEGFEHYPGVLKPGEKLDGK